MARPRNEQGRDEIRRAAFSLFMRQGYEKTTYRDIALSTRKSRATVQSLFPKKEQLAADMVNRVVLGCQAFAEREGLAAGDALEQLSVIGQLYFGFLLHDAGLQAFTFDLAAQRVLTSSSLLFNEEWVEVFLNVGAEEVKRCMDAFLLAMGGGYEIVYQRLQAGEDVNVSELVALVIKGFVATCGIQRIADGYREFPALDADVVDASIDSIRQQVLS